jgi:eukaryotic-like serine/threonine-protein kinase
MTLEHPSSVPRGGFGAFDAPTFNNEVVALVKIDHAEWAGSQGGALTYDSWGESHSNNIPVRLLSRSNGCDSKLLSRLIDDVPLLPEVGQAFAGFQLIGDLGRGAFGRVYLARQGDLADRPVALKVSTGCFAESQKLARLQHTHIVPVYSFHRAGALQAVCMPYLGSTTLADILDDLGQRQTLPASGKGLVSTLNSKRGKSGPFPQVKPAAPIAPSRHPSLATSPPAGTATLTTLRMLEGMTYVEAVLWIGARLAEGLAHAHERGVLHRDLKPANVLLTEEGQPMLLDFNLAQDIHETGAAGARVGGTLPYMAPEHLAAYQGRPVDVDARGDLYALGVILYELLTRRHPFDKHTGQLEDVIPQMVKDRLRPPPSARGFNPDVSPAVDSILRRCLAPNLARRYQTARQLQEDLDRQRQHQPLRYAADPSPRERITKWVRRHPRAVTGTRIGIAAGFLLVLLALWLCYRGVELARYEAAAELKDFRADLNVARLMLAARNDDATQIKEGREAARRALNRYRADIDPRWLDQPKVARLPQEEKDRFQADIGELLLLTASADVQWRAPQPDVLEEAMRMNRIAEVCYPTGAAPQMLWKQRAQLEELLGHADDARQLRELAEETPQRNAGDVYMQARELAARGQATEAANMLRATADHEPGNFAVQFQMGNLCLDGYYESRGKETQAVGYYSACLALRPDFHFAYSNRGLAYLRGDFFEDAEADATRAIALRPNQAEYYLLRARARDGLRRYQSELEDLNKAESLGSNAVLLYYLRTRVNKKLWNDEQARRDMDRALTITPADEENLVARGLAREENGDMEGALADFTQVVQQNPNSAAGLRDQASVLSEKLGRDSEALAPLNRLIELYPAYARAWGARGVVRARLGWRDDALTDVHKALELDPVSGRSQDQAACAYALTSGQHPADRDEAFRFLSVALRKGRGWERLHASGNLALLQTDQRFAELVRIAELLQMGEH